MDNLGTAERQRLFEQFGKSFSPGDQLYAVDEPADSCFIIHTGRVRLSKGVRKTPRCFAVLTDGDLFGEELFSPAEVRRSTAVALTQISVLSFNRATLTALLNANAQVAMRLMGQVIRRLQYAEEQVENSMLHDRPSRVIHSLLREATRGSNNVNEACVLNLSPLQLSSRAGLDVEVVKALMTTFEERGYVRIEGEAIVISDLAALRELFTLLGTKEEVRAGFI